MRRKTGKRMIKKAAAVALSAVLVLGMFWGNCRLEARAEENVDAISPYTVTNTFVLTLDGYVGEGTPEFGKVVLRLSYDHDSRAYVEIGEEQMSRSGSGTVLTYTYTFEGGKYYNVYWGIDAGRGFIGLTNMMTGTGFFGEDEDKTTFRSATAYCFRFIDGNDVYYEQYSRTTHEIYDFNNPEKIGHIFKGWTEEGKNKILSLSDIKSRIVGRSITYYAVWEHPDEETWDWNSNDESHWKECSCKELKTEAEAHKWDDGTITRQPTESLEGETTYICTDCGKARTEPIPATGKPTVSGNDSVSGNDPALPAKPDVPENPDTPVNPDLPGNADAPINADVPGSSQASEANPTNETVNQNHTGAATAGSVNSTASNGRNGEPKTGEIPYIEIYATTAMIAGMAYLFFYFRDEERGMSEEEKAELVACLVAWAKKGGYFRRIAALTAIFFLLCYYHSIGKKSYVQWKAFSGKQV